MTSPGCSPASGTCARRPSATVTGGPRTTAAPGSCATRCIGFRSTGGPFRCLAGLAVSPRPYQLVPLLLALRQDTVRLLIADDVGIGKTIEAGLVAAELLAQGSARRLTVLCPPSLATQWQQELSEKFGMDAELVLPGTVRRLERTLTGDESIFTRYPVTVVSTDFIKSNSRRYEFLRAAPDRHRRRGPRLGQRRLGRGSSGRTALPAPARPRRRPDPAPHPRHRHTTAAMRPPSAIHRFLDEALADVDLGTEAGRRALADHLVQRRRADIRHYLQQDTKFPRTAGQERSYRLNPTHRALFDDVLAYVRGQVRDTSGTKLEQRVRWWSALSLLRAVASSPAAARATLATRSASASAETAAAADELGRAEVLDLAEDDALDGADSTPGAVADTEPGGSRRVLSRLHSRPPSSKPPRRTTKAPSSSPRSSGSHRQDPSDRLPPIVFCRFIRPPTVTATCEPAAASP